MRGICTDLWGITVSLPKSRQLSDQTRYDRPVSSALIPLVFPITFLCRIFIYVHGAPLQLENLESVQINIRPPMAVWLSNHKYRNNPLCSENHYAAVLLRERSNNIDFLE